tara:strand:+ start:29 stop:226 length:198 start_codon:yes stop_codon:yes gene_type:complete
MKKKINNEHLLAAIIFSLAGLIHLYRILSGSVLKLNEFVIPMWLSGLAVLVAGFLAIHFWKDFKN